MNADLKLTAILLLLLIAPCLAQERSITLRSRVVDANTGDRRNEVRLPDYARWDVRVSKAFLFKRWKLTATGEVLNLLNRNNLRYAGFDFFDPITGRVFGQLDRVLPILPSAGVVIEF